MSSATRIRSRARTPSQSRHRSAPRKSKDPASFWNFLANKGDAISEVPGDRWNLESFYDAEGSCRTHDGPLRWLPRRHLRLRPGLLRHLAARGREHGPASSTAFFRSYTRPCRNCACNHGRADRTVTGVFVGITMSDYRSLLECNRTIPANDIYCTAPASRSALPPTASPTSLQSHPARASPSIPPAPRRWWPSISPCEHPRTAPATWRSPRA